MNETMDTYKLTREPESVVTEHAKDALYALRELVSALSVVPYDGELQHMIECVEADIVDMDCAITAQQDILDTLQAGAHEGEEWLAEQLAELGVFSALEKS